MMKLEEIKYVIPDLPSYFRLTNIHEAPLCNTFVLFGNAKHNTNLGFAVEERQCANRVCRILSPEKTIDKALVIRDDGSVWQVRISNFDSVKRIIVTE